MNVGIYVHIPFCRSKCLYCDFVSYTLDVSPLQEKKIIGDYLKILITEATYYHERFPRLTAETLYIGGGTPTCLTGGQLFDLLEGLRSYNKIKPNAEITVEGNPGTLDREKLKALKAGGCNRLSLGIQSFQGGELEGLGRIHSVEDVYNTYNLAREEGFNNISIDLMYGLPGQSLESWQYNLSCALSLEPEHISLYQLKIEEGTPYYRRLVEGKIAEFDQDVAFQMYDEGIERLSLKGYHHYEISNFSRPGKESRHNKTYWLNQEYLGLGAGAAGYLDGWRYNNFSQLNQYKIQLQKGSLPVESRQHITRELAMSETMFLGLRLTEGVSKEDFEKRFLISINDQYQETVARLKKRGLLLETATHLALTRSGRPLANEVFVEFI